MLAQCTQGRFATVGHRELGERQKRKLAGVRAWELCSWRGLASLPSRPMGEEMRRRWDSVLAYVSRFSTCMREHET